MDVSIHIEIIWIGNTDAAFTQGITGDQPTGVEEVDRAWMFTVPLMVPPSMNSPKLFYRP